MDQPQLQTACVAAYNQRAAAFALDEFRKTSTALAIVVGVMPPVDGRPSNTVGIALAPGFPKPLAARLLRAAAEVLSTGLETVRDGDGDVLTFDIVRPGAPR